MPRQRLKSNGSEGAVSLIVVGLGNNGEAYQGTRHNVGFSIIDALCEVQNLSFQVYSKKYCYACYNATDSEGAARYRSLMDLPAAPPSPSSQIVLVKPLTQINNSGLVMHPLQKRYPEYWHNHYPLVLCDTLDLPVGKTRFKPKGGSAGHNGLKSIIGVIGTQFPRIYVGVDRPPTQQAINRYVLARPTSAERPAYDSAIDKVATALRLSGGSLTRVITHLQEG